MLQTSPLRIALHHAGHHKGRLVWALLWRTIYILIPLQIPLLTGLVVDILAGKPTILHGWQLPNSSLSTMLTIAIGGLLLIALAHALSTYMQSRAAANLSRHIVAQLRQSVFERLMVLPLRDHQRFGAGELLERAMSDTAALRRFVERLFIQTGTNALRVLYPITILFTLDWQLALAALAILPAQRGVTRGLQQRLLHNTRQRRATRSDLVSTVKEQLDHIETIKTLAAEDAAVRQMGDHATTLEQDELRTVRVAALIRSVVWFTTSIGLAITWWWGGYKVIQGEMSVGVLVTFTGFVTLAYQPFRQFTKAENTYHRGTVSMERIQELLDLPLPQMEQSETEPLQIEQGTIAFRNVHFRYDQWPVLNVIHLTLSPHSLTTIVGPSGAGKSSLLRLVTRLYTPERGQILIDGQSIDTVALASLRTQVALVPQKSVLFSGSVRDNITLGHVDVTETDVIAAATAAGAVDFIEQLPNGFDTHLGRNGASLSGGQIQRIAIARALLHHPKILLLDEPTSALDAEQEVALLQTLLHLRQQMTVVVITHRPEAMRNADQVVVLEGGTVVAQDTHQALLKSSELYRTLVGEQPTPTGKNKHTLIEASDYV